MNVGIDSEIARTCERSSGLDLAHQTADLDQKEGILLAFLCMRSGNAFQYVDAQLWKVIGIELEALKQNGSMGMLSSMRMRRSRRIRFMCLMQ